MSIDEILLSVGLTLFAIILSVATAYVRREDSLRASRVKVARQFDDRANLGALQEYMRTLLRVFATDILHEPLNDYPPVAMSAIEYVKRMGRLAGTRMGVAMSNAAVRFTALPPGHAGRVQLRNGVYYIDIAEEYANDSLALAAITVHEVAHVALSSKGVGFKELQANEELTDALTILAGFGPIMLRASYRERRWLSQDSSLGASTHRLGYLNPVAMAYLAVVQSELIHRPLAPVRGAELWLRTAMKLRKRALRRRLSSVERDQTDRIECDVCGTWLRLPDTYAKIVVRCPVCTTSRPLTLERRIPIWRRCLRLRRSA